MRHNWTTKGLLALLAVVTLGGGAIVRAEDGQVGGHAFSIGPRASYGKAKGADEGNWFGGAQVRFGLGNAVGLEGSIDYRKDEYADGAVVVKTYPVQASLLIYLAPDAPVSPYLLGGGGWYHSRVEVGDFHETDYRFGPHAGGGLEVALGPSMSLDGSYRYIWLKALESQDENELTAEYNDSGHMVTIGLNFKF